MKLLRAASMEEKRCTAYYDVGIMPIDNDNYIIKTPSGTPVTCQYTDVLLNNDANTAAAEAANYNGVLVSVSYKNFNCHAYAWLDKGSNEYMHIWLNFVSAFLADPAYTKSNTATVGAIANSPAHSAIVLEVNKLAPSGKPEP